MEDKKTFKRKRKDSFLRKTKKYRKRAVSRHGTHVDDDIFRYFCRVLDVWNKGFDSEEDKCMFANNVLEQTRGKEMELCTSQLTCRAIETVLDAASDDSLIALETALKADLRVAFVDVFCSHLTQKLIMASARRVAESNSDGEDSFCVLCIKFAFNNVEEFAWHTYACHVVRSCLDGLALISDKVSSKFTKLFYGAVIESPIVVDISSVELGSGLLQAFLRCLHKSDKKRCQKAVSVLLEEVFCPDAAEVVDDSKQDEDGKDKIAASQHCGIPKVFTSQPSIRLLECAIECSSSKRFTHIYAKLFINKLVTLALDRSANMAVQALIRSAEDKTEYEGIFDELVDSLKDILSAGHTGVLVSLAASCHRLATRQGQLIQALLQCVGCQDSGSDLCPRLLSLNNYIDSKEKVSQLNPNAISLHGSLIVQSLLHFHKPIKVINSLMSMDTERLLKVMCDPRGCHISDAFFKAAYIGEKSREKLFHKIKEGLVELVVSKHGSRSFEALWSGINGKLRSVAASKLSERESVVTASQFGTIVASKIKLSTYRHDPRGWATAINNSSSRDPQALFADIISVKT